MLDEMKYYAQQDLKPIVYVLVFGILFWSAMAVVSKNKGGSLGAITETEKVETVRKSRHNLFDKRD